VKSWSVGGIDDGACRVLDASGNHVGNLKWIRGVWKFKAIGHDASGAVIPGGGPLTDRHNTVFGRLDPVQINRALRLVPALVPGEYGQTRLGEGRTAALVDELALQACDEAFGHGVVDGISDAADQHMHAQFFAAYVLRKPPEGKRDEQ
jgi:hypothetical protein